MYLGQLQESVTLVLRQDIVCQHPVWVSCEPHYLRLE